MSSECIDDLIIRLKCTDGIIHVIRERLKCSRLICSLQKEFKNNQLINDVDIPFSKYIVKLAIFASDTVLGIYEIKEDTQLQFFMDVIKYKDDIDKIINYLDVNYS